MRVIWPLFATNFLILTFSLKFINLSLLRWLVAKLMEERMGVMKKGCSTLCYGTLSKLTCVYVLCSSSAASIVCVCTIAIGKHTYVCSGMCTHLGLF